MNFNLQGGRVGKQGKMMESGGSLGWGQRDFIQKCSLYLWQGRGWGGAEAKISKSKMASSVQPILWRRQAGAQAS